MYAYNTLEASSVPHLLAFILSLSLSFEREKEGVTEGGRETEVVSEGEGGREGGRVSECERDRSERE